MYLETCLAISSPEAALRLLVISQSVKKLLLYPQLKHMNWHEVQRKDLDLTTLPISEVGLSPNKIQRA